MPPEQRASPPVYIWVRTAIDWADEDGLRASLRPDFLPKLDRWNATFTLPYHRFRHEVSEIARLNLSRVAGAEVRAWDEIPEGAVVLPVDDDDWFAPDVVERIAPSLRDDAVGCRWQPVYVEVPTGLRHRAHLLRLHLVPGARPTYSCATNGYAIVKRGDVETLARWHVQASKAFDRDAGRVGTAPPGLSVVNRTLASQTTLHHDRPAISARLLRRKWRAYRTLYARADLGGAEWAREYVERMASLMDRLVLSTSGAPA